MTHTCSQQSHSRFFFDHVKPKVLSPFRELVWAMQKKKKNMSRTRAYLHKGHLFSLFRRLRKVVSQGEVGSDREKPERERSEHERLRRHRLPPLPEGPTPDQHRRHDGRQHAEGVEKVEEDRRLRHNRIVWCFRIPYLFILLEYSIFIVDARGSGREGNGARTGGGGLLVLVCCAASAEN